MADDGHGEFTATSIEGPLDPRQLSFVYGAQDAGVSIASRAKSSVCNSKKGARWIPTFMAYSRRRRAACAIRLSIRRAFVPVNPRSASTRASIALRAALGSRKFALKLSSASNQS